MFFVPPRGRKWSKNRSKTNLKAVLSWEAKTTPKHGPKWLQHGSKIDPSWGHVGLQSRHGPAQERSQDDVNKNVCKKLIFWAILEASWAGKSKKEPPRMHPPGWPEGWVDCKFARIGKNCQELPWCLAQLHPLRGGAGSTCPAGQPRHRALGLS